MPTTFPKLIERMGGRVDREAGVIRGVKLLGRKSRNGRTYSERALRNGVALYAGRKVFVDHPRQSEANEDRRFRDWVGVIENPKFAGDGIYGDIRLRKQSEHFEALIEAATEFNGFFGLSHVADGDSRYQGSEEIVESIAEVYSVDIVTEPATAAGLFEGDGHLPELSDPVSAFDVAPVPQCRRSVECIAELLSPKDQVPFVQEIAGALSDLAETLVDIEKQALAELTTPRRESHSRRRDHPASEPDHEWHWMPHHYSDEELRRFAARYR
jgi:hypothetical protein